VVKNFDAVELRVIVGAVFAVAADAVLVAHHLTKPGAHLVTALTPACARSHAKKQPGGGEQMREKGRGRAEKQACIPNGKIKWLYNSNLSSCGRLVKLAGCGRVRSRNICFGHVLIAVRQGRKRCDAVAAGDKQLGRCMAGRLYLNIGKLTLAAMYLRRVRVADRSFAAGAPTPAVFYAVLTPPAPAAQHLGVGFRRPCRGKTEPLFRP
jgi:hypothetical protein